MKPTLTRRSVLRGAVAGAVGGLAAPMFVPSSVFGSKGKPAANDRVNLAFVGLGNQGLANLSNPYQESYNLKGGFIAMRLRRPLRWDGLRERFVGDEEADRMLHRPMRSPWSV
jgi:hypothetical protein